MPKSSTRAWKDYTAQEKRQIYITLGTISSLLILWVASDFLSALAMVLLAYSLYYIYRSGRSREFRKKNTTIAIVLFVLFAAIMPSPEPRAGESSQSAIAAVEDSPEEVARKIEEARLAELAREEAVKKEQEEIRAKEAQARQIQPTGDLYQVIAVTDGDTIKVSINGSTETVRLIGLDTPETKDPRKPIQCFGQEAASQMQSLVHLNHVRLAVDDSQDTRDRYGRLLRYVFLEDGRNVAYEMIKGGYGHEYTYSVPYQYQAQFKEAQRHARENGIGLWSPNTCNGVTNQELPPEPSPSSQTPPAAPPPQQSQPATYYANCTAARAAGAAPVYAGQPGYGTHLDRDRDGIGCE